MDSMNTAAAVKVTRKLRNDVAKASDGLPDLGTWLARIRGLDVPALTEAVEGIWCGRDGKEVLNLDGAKSMLVVGWHNGRVEYSYIS